MATTTVEDLVAEALESSADKLEVLDTKEVGASLREYIDNGKDDAFAKMLERRVAEVSAELLAMFPEEEIDIDELREELRQEYERTRKRLEALTVDPEPKPVAKSS